MKVRLHVCLLLGLAFALIVAISARSDDECRNTADEGFKKAPISLIGVIPVPGSPITSADIAWTDPGTERYYFADRSNNGVDIIDAEDDVWVGRVSGFVGNPPAPNTGGGTPTTNGPGPNGVVVTPNRELWAGDGNSTVQVADVDPNSADYLKITHSISTAISACDAGTNAHYCGRADEIGYDPLDHIILIANPSPLSTATGHAGIDPYASFISAKTDKVLGTVTFAGAGGLEQPLWDPQIGKFLITVPGKGAVSAKIAKIDAVTEKVLTTYDVNCALIPGVATPNSTSITGIVLGENQHFLVSACGSPIILTLKPTSGSTGSINVIKVITQVGGGDEVWHNPGDENFYVTGPDTSNPPVNSLGVIDEEKSAWLQNVPNLRGRNPAAFAENNHIFTIVSVSAPTPANPHPVDTGTCASFGFIGTGCIAVFEHNENAAERADNDN